jgi:hypothetical protein
VGLGMGLGTGEEGGVYYECLILVQWTALLRLRCRVVI